MRSLEKIFADLLLVDLLHKDSIRAEISKNEFDLMVEAYKKDHEDRVYKCDQLTEEQKWKLKDKFNKAVDNLKEYSQECLSINGRLID